MKPFLIIILCIFSLSLLIRGKPVDEIGNNFGDSLNATNILNINNATTGNKDSLTLQNPEHFY